MNISVKMAGGSKLSKVPIVRSMFGLDQKEKNCRIPLLSNIGRFLLFNPHVTDGAKQGTWTEHGGGDACSGPLARAKSPHCM